MRKAWRAVVVGLVVGIAGTGSAWGLGGNLDRPSIAIPTDPQTNQSDTVVRALNDALSKHTKTFTGGSFINAFSVLSFGGGATGINALLADLARVEGATIQVRFSNEVGETRRFFPDKSTDAPRACDCQVQHSGWGNARTLTVTIFLGGDRIVLGDLDLPPILGHSAHEETPGRP